MRIVRIEETDSTNTEVKKYLAGGENVVLIAERQTGGKGTKGRSFLSLEGGIYLSALTFYENVPAREAFRVMAHAAVAVAKTAKSFGADPEIKWPNDVLVCGRKLCGILIENELSDGLLRSSIAGIGLNVNNDLTALGGVAIGLSEAVGRKIFLEEAQDALVQNLSEKDSFDEYLSYLRFLGREVTVMEGGREYRAVAKRVFPDGRLEIEEGGRLRALSAAEISLRTEGQLRR